MMITNSHSEPSPVADAEFLLFLADSVEQDGELLDALSMANEKPGSNTGANTGSSDITESNEVRKQAQTSNAQEDSHE